MALILEYLTLNIEHTPCIRASPEIESPLVNTPAFSVPARSSFIPSRGFTFVRVRGTMNRYNLCSASLIAIGMAWFDFLVFSPDLFKMNIWLGPLSWCGITKSSLAAYPVTNEITTHHSRICYIHLHHFIRVHQQIFGIALLGAAGHPKNFPLAPLSPNWLG